MSRQLSLDYFYKSKASPALSQSSNDGTMSTKVKKRRSLSLIKAVTPSKAAKVNADDGVINLCSDEEESSLSIVRESVNASPVPNSQLSDSSGATIVYNINIETPIKTPQRLSNSSGTREKYYSPSKKRSVVKRSPTKRNLAHQFSASVGSAEDEVFNKACEGMDDKTISLLTTINNFLNNDSLRHLLTEESLDLLRKSFCIVKPGMRLVCRLYWWMEGWYRLSKVQSIASMNNDPVDSVSVQFILVCLIENGFIKKSNNNITFDEFKSILSANDIKKVCKDLKLKVKSKADGFDALKNFSRCSTNISNYFSGGTSDNYRRVVKIMNEKAGPCYRLTELARSTLYKLYLLMYLGIDYKIIREKKLELTLIYDKIKRETYPVSQEMVLDNASVVFKDRYEFNRFMHAHLIYEEMLSDSFSVSNEKCSMIEEVFCFYKELSKEELASFEALPPWLRKYTSGYLYIRTLEAGVQDLKRDKSGRYYTLALDILSALITQTIFRQHKKAEWYSEKASILHNILKRFNETAEVLLEGFNSQELSDEDKDSMRTRASKIASQKNTTLDDDLKRVLLEHATKDSILERNLTGEHIYKQPMENLKSRGKKKFETRTEDGRVIQDAEEYCITHYLKSGKYTHGQHWEGKIVTTIFFLLFWDIIYSKPRHAIGIFMSHFQRYPLDMFHEAFYTNRRDEIEDMLNTIELSSVEKIISLMRDRWMERPEWELSGINRDIGWDNISMVATCLGPHGTSVICRRLATNYKYTHSGFPDLTMWNVQTRKIKFVEVKTDTDKPSLKQIQWMHYLRENCIATEFCYVGVNTTRCKSRPNAKGEES